MTKRSLFHPNAKSGAYLSPSFHIEADGRGKYASLLISGVIGVKELTEREILIVTKNEAFTVVGELLSVTVLESNRIKAVGVIDSITFSKRKRGRVV